MFVGIVGFFLIVDEILDKYQHSWNRGLIIDFSVVDGGKWSPLEWA